MYFTAVSDWSSRYVLSWRLSHTLEGRFCLEALDDSDSRSAIKSLCDKGLQKPDFANHVHLDKRQQRVAISDSVKSCD